MKVKLKTCMAGPSGTFFIGDIVEDNGDLVKGGYAEPIESVEISIKTTEPIEESNPIKLEKNRKKSVKLNEL